MGTAPKNKAIDAEYLLNQLKNLDKNILETKYVQEKDVKDTYTATDENPISGKGVSVVVNTLQQDINGKSNIGHKHTKSEITDFPTSMTPTAHTHDDRYYTESEIDTKLNSKLNTSLKGSANGLAELDSNGKVLSSQLPSFVDDIVEGYLSGGKFYKESAHTTEITGETGKIYIDLTTNKTYRWSGSAFVVVSETLALGETSSTAYRGDRGKIAYDHSQSIHARTDATKVEKSSTNGNIKINGTETTVYTHPSGTNPHGTTKSDVGLSNVPNVATNDQTPSYTEATTLAKLTSGEKLSVAFGKISKAITDLISHIGNKSNPHGVTKSQVGLGNVENKSSATIRSELTKDNVTTALGYTPPTTNTTYGVATSSTPGLVKSGTDITVDSSGNVSVNDDSHNHVISNVDGLQSALDGKAASSHTHTKSEVGLGNVDNTADASKNVKSSKKLQTYKQGSTTETYGDTYSIYAQWRDPSHVKMKCDNYTVETDYATSAGSASSVAWNNVTGKPSTYTPSSHTHTKSQITDFPSSLPANGGNSSTVNGHTVNSDVPSGAKFTDTDTWRPLGTTADTACAGNDSRLSNARPASDVYAWAKASSKPSYSWSEITNKPSTFTPASHTHDYLPLSGGTITGGPLNIRFSGSGNWNEGIRIHESNDWTTIALCSSDNTGDTGTSANTWSIHNNNGNFYIARNGSNSSSSAILSCINNSWSINNNAIIHSGNIGSQSVNYASSAGNADTLDGNHASAFATASALDTHKSSGDHDKRYYTKTEINKRIKHCVFQGSVTYSLPYMSGCIAFVGDHNIPGLSAIIYMLRHPGVYNEFAWYEVAGDFSSHYTISKNSDNTVTITSKRSDSSMWAVFIS